MIMQKICKIENANSVHLGQISMFKSFKWLQVIQSICPEVTLSLAQLTSTNSEIALAGGTKGVFSTTQTMLACPFHVLTSSPSL